MQQEAIVTMLNQLMYDLHENGVLRINPFSDPISDKVMDELIDTVKTNLKESENGKS